MTSITEMFGQSATVSPAGILTVDLSELAATASYEGDYASISGGKAIAIILSSFRERLGDTSADPTHAVSLGTEFRSLLTRGTVDMIAYSSTLSVYGLDTIGGLDPDNVL